MSCFDKIPNELQVYILLFLSKEDLIVSRAVCLQWREIIQIHYLIDYTFTRDDFQKYLNQFCFNFDFIKRNIERIPIGVFFEMQRIYFEKKSLNGFAFYDEFIGKCNEDYLKYLYVNNDFEMMDHFKEKFPCVYEIHQNKINGNFNNDVLKYASFLTAFRNSPKTAKKWIRNEKNWKYICLDDANEIVGSGVWDSCKKIIVSGLDCPLVDMLLSLGIKKISKYILSRSYGWEFEIKNPNRDAIMLCGDQIMSESIVDMILIDRLDLARLIVSFRPQYQYDMFYTLLVYRHFQEAFEQLKFLDVKQLDIHRIHSIIVQYGTLDILLSIYDQMELQFPFCPDCPNKCCLITHLTQFSKDEIKRFIELGGQCIYSLDAEKFEPKRDITRFVKCQFRREITKYITISNIEFIHWKNLKLEDIKWLIGKFGIVTINEILVRNNIDMVHIAMENGDLDMAIWMIQNNITRQLNTNQLIIHTSNWSLQEMKIKITELFKYLNDKPIISFSDKAKIPDRIRTRLLDWYKNVLRGNMQ